MFMRDLLPKPQGMEVLFHTSQGRNEKEEQVQYTVIFVLKSGLFITESQPDVC